MTKNTYNVLKYRKLGKIICGYIFMKKKYENTLNHVKLRPDLILVPYSKLEYNNLYLTFPILLKIKRDIFKNYQSLC